MPITDEILKVDGVIASDVISPATTDDIQVKDWVLNIDKLILNLPETADEAKGIKNAALDNPLLKNLLVSQDGKAVALYIPIKSKQLSYKISEELKKIIEKHKGPEIYHITGLPVAEDTFGIEIFKEMAVSSPLALLAIFLLMYLFFRSFIIIISPMVVAMFTVIWTMGFLIGLGFTVHIMNSMIPIFLMPIAVVDSIHILSDFFERFTLQKGKKMVILKVMDELFTPMLYTSITTAVGFASLALTPITPVRVFGIFVSIGIVIAWLLTLTIIPAFTVLVPERYLKGLRRGRLSLINRAIEGYGRFTVRWSKWIIASFAAIFIVSLIGVRKIEINDNPVRWFKEGHLIREADKVFNSHFGGSYLAYLVLKDNKVDAMKDAKTMEYITSLQEYLKRLDVVGKVTSVADVVRKINYELHNEDKAFNNIPNDKETIAQYLFLYEMSGDGQDLYHLVDYEYKKANIWVQLKSGDNKDMPYVEKAVEEYIKNNPPPYRLKTEWTGLTYVNVAWQENMLWGMLNALLSSFIVVFLIMLILFRSFILAAISMLPLTVTITFTYGLIGFIGKDYDMQVAVLSALSLGLSIDFAIHFIQRARHIFNWVKGWEETGKEMFKEPVIARNAVIIAFGFTPLLFATLVPYITVGLFMIGIMLTSGIAALTLLPAIMEASKGRLFKKKGGAST